MARKLKADRPLFFTTLLLLAVSIVMVYSASKVMATEKFGQPNLFLFKQAMFAAIGLGAMFAASRVDYEHYRDPRVIWTVVGITLLALVAVLLIGPRINGSRRWFAVAGIGIQPSELAKLAVILFTAAVLERRMDQIDKLKYALGPIVVLTVPVVGLILLQKDLGTSVVVLTIVCVMVFAAGLPFRYVGLVAAVSAAGFATAVIVEPYRMRRLAAFLDPWADRFGDGFQAVQSLIAVGSGGVMGRGLMYGVQKLFYLPEPHSDFIFAVLSEELGLLGGSVMVVAFCIVTWRGLRTASRAPDAFGAFLALGLATMFAVQAFVNISVVLGLLPTKGIPLPFISAGGSSLIISLVGMGVLLNISQRASATT